MIYGRDTLAFPTFFFLDKNYDANLIYAYAKTLTLRITGFVLSFPNNSMAENSGE